MKIWKWKFDSICFVIGGVMLIAGEFMHPEPPMQSADLLRMIAMHPHWSAIHAVQIAAVLILCLGFALLRSRFASMNWSACVVFATLGAALLCAALVLDGGGFPQIAKAWMSSQGADRGSVQRIFEIALQVQDALLVLGAMCFYGIVLFTSGLMLARNDVARWMGWVGAGFGAAFMVISWCALAGASLPPLPWYPLMALVAALWSVILGTRLAWGTEPSKIRIA